MKRYSASLIVREVPVKATTRYHFTLSRMAIIKEMDVASVGENVEKLEPLINAGSNIRWCNHFGKQFFSSSKSYAELAYDPKF